MWNRVEILISENLLYISAVEWDVKITSKIFNKESKMIWNDRNTKAYQSKQKKKKKKWQENEESEKERVRESKISMETKEVKPKTEKYVDGGNNNDRTNEGMQHKIESNAIRIVGNTENRPMRFVEKTKNIIRWNLAQWIVTVVALTACYNSHIFFLILFFLNFIWHRFESTDFVRFGWVQF